jgi:glycolate oxidase iron-sulfur subunit
MKTTFTLQQLQKPQIKQAEQILGDCVHYGFCTNTCPTYVLTRDENDAPRGRIDLIHEMLETDGPPKASTVYHLDRCLSCLTCVTSCAVKVDYMHLIDIAREHIEEHYKRPLSERFSRWMVATAVPRPALFQTSLLLARLAKPIKGFLPKTLERLVALAPRQPAHVAKREVESAVAPSAKRYRVSLLEGCAQSVLDPEIHASTVRLLERHGCEVVVPKSRGCCGALTLHMGLRECGKAAAKRAIDGWHDESERGLDAVILNASGCGTTVKDYVNLFDDDPVYRDKAKWVSQRTVDITEFISRIGLKATTRLDFEVAYHDACSLRNAQRVTEEPRALLRATGLIVRDTPEGHFCCGSAGTYNIFQPELADSLGARKAANLESTGAQFAAMGNIGCLTQLRRLTGMPLVHTVQLLDWATGGPRPVQLSGIRESVKKIPIEQEEEHGLW